MVDDFAALGEGLQSPAVFAAAVTPGAAQLTDVTRALYVGATGDVQVTMAGGGDITFKNCQQGTWLPIRVSRVLAGTNIIALW